MQQWLGSIAILAAIMVVVAVAGMWLWRSRIRRGGRQRRRGDRAANGGGAPQQSAGDGRRRGELDLTPRTLTDDERTAYVRRWVRIERDAAAQPATALLDADEMLAGMLRDIGYPVGRFVEHAADMSAEHGAVVHDYRVARNVTFDTRLGLAGTAEIREAIRRYRCVFERLTGTTVSCGADETATSGGQP